MYTLATLKQAIIDYTENNTSEVRFTSNLENFIRMAEERILKATQLQIFQDTQQDIVLAGVRTIPKPCDWLATYSLQLMLAGTPDNRITLWSKDKTLLDEYWPDHTATGVPRYYADQSVTLFTVAPTPAVDYTVIVNYLLRPQSLVDTVAVDAQTWLSTNAPQALLYACLSEAFGFLKNDVDMQRYEARFTEAIVRMRNHGDALEPDDAARRSVVRKDRV